MIATLGNFEFEVSTGRVKTFSDLQFSHSASYAEHKVIGRKGLIEFTGLNASSASLSIKLLARLGVNPVEEIAALYDIMNSHEALVFTIGGEVKGSGLWVIESIEEQQKVIDSQGSLIEANLSVKLKECVEA